MPWVVDLRSGGREGGAAVSRLRRCGLCAFGRVADGAGRKDEAVDLATSLLQRRLLDASQQLDATWDPRKALAAKGRKHD